MKHKRTPNTTKGDGAFVVCLHLQIYDHDQQANDNTHQIARHTKRINAAKVLLTNTAAVQAKNPTLDIAKMVGKDIDTFLCLCVPANKRVEIMTKSVADRRAKLLEENITETKICACVEDTTRNVSELKKQMSTHTNQVVETSADISLLES